MSRLAAERRLRVLLTTDVVGGVWDFCCALGAELTRAGHGVALLAFGRPSREQRQQAAVLGLRLTSADLKLEWMRDSDADAVAARHLAARVAQELGADVVHGNQYTLGLLAPELPVVVTAHSDVLSWLKWNQPDALAGGVPVEWRGYARLVRAGLETADATVAVSHFVAEEVTALYGLSRTPAVVHNGWPAPSGPPRPFADRPRLTLMAGRAWDSAKNVRLGVEAAQGWDVGRVQLIGDQHHPETGSPAQIDPPVELLGWLGRPDVDRRLGEARIYLAPARYEPFGLLPLQAALAGCALLLSDVPSFRELWEGAALFFHSDDPDDLRRQWRRLLGDGSLGSELAERGRGRALTRYRPETMAEAYLRLYWTAIEAHAGRALEAVSA